MTDEPKRARRRRDLERMKAKAKRVRPDFPQAVTEANHLAACSCWMCGNPRRYEGRVTVQEMRASQSAE